MRAKFDSQEVAKKLRVEGFSIKQIAQRLKVSPSSVSIWTRYVKISSEGKLKIQKRIINSKRNNLSKKFEKQRELLSKLDNKISFEIRKIEFTKIQARLLCSFLYWGEGAKSGSSVSLINSDPELVKTFLFLLRKGFNLDEKKFRCLVHVHEYHNNDEIKKYWSSVTKIPLTQFQKSFRKKNSAKTIRDGYKGSVAVKYYDHKIYKELKLLYKAFYKEMVLRGIG